MENSCKFYSYQKVIIFGAEGTGKTSLIKSLNGKILTEDNYNYYDKNKSMLNRFKKFKIIRFKSI